MTARSGQHTYKYDAFISYAHESHGPQADPLQRALHRFARPWFKLRALHVYCDRTNMDWSDPLWESLRHALDASHYLIVLASPAAAASEWVNKEVGHWLTTRSPKSIAIGLVRGELAWNPRTGAFTSPGEPCLPLCLTGAFPEEPFFVDLRPASVGKPSLRNEAFRDAVATLAAPLHGKSKERLYSEDARQRVRRMLGLSLAALLVLGALATALWWRKTAEAERKAAVIAQAVERAQELAAAAEVGMEKRPQLRLLLAHGAVEATRGLGVHVPEAEQALRRALTQCTGVGFGGHPARVTALETSADGQLLASGDQDGSVWLWTIKPDGVPERRCLLKHHTAAVLDILFSQDGRRLVTADDDLLVCVWDLTIPTPEQPLHVLRGGKDYSEPGVEYTVGFRSIDFGFSRVALGGDRWLVTVAAENSAYLWDLSRPSPEKEAIALRGHRKSVRAVAITPDGKWAVTGSEDGTIRLWSLESPFPSVSYLQLAGQARAIRSIAVSPDDRWLATGTGEGATIELAGIKQTVYLWDLSAADPAESAVNLPGHEYSIFSLCFSRDSRWLITSDQGSNVFRWDLHSDRPERNPIRLRAQAAVYSVGLSGDGDWLAAGGYKPTLDLWDLRVEPPRAFTLPGHEGLITSLSFNPRLPYLVSGSQDGTLRMWDLRMPDPSNPEVLLLAAGPAEHVALTPNHEWMATGHKTGEIRLWNLARGGNTPVRTLTTGSKSEVQSVSLSHDGRWLTSSRAGEGLLVFDLQAADSAALTLAPAQHLVGDCQIRGDGHWIACAGEFSARRPMLSQFSSQGWGKVVLLPQHRSTVTWVQFGATDRWLATGTVDGLVCLWDLTQGKWEEPALTLEGHGKSITQLAFSPHDRWLAAGSNDAMALSEESKEPSARLWDLEAYDPSANPAPVFGPEVVYDVGFLAEGKLLFVAGGFGRTRATFWRPRAGAPAEEAFVFVGGKGTVLAAAASRDSRRFALSGADGKTFLWDLAAKNPITSRVELPSMAGICMLSFSDDGRYLLAFSSALEVRKWPVDEEVLLNRVARTVGRNMSRSEWEEFFGSAPYEKSFPGLEIAPPRAEAGLFKILKLPSEMPRQEGEKPVHVTSFSPETGTFSSVQRAWESRRRSPTLVTLEVESNVLKVTHRESCFYAPYTVRENRTFAAIAQEVYGSERYAEYLSQANRLPLETPLQEGAIVYVIAKTIPLALTMPKEQIAVVEEFVKGLGTREVQIKWGKGDVDVDFTQATAGAATIRKYDVRDLEIFARGTQRPMLVLNFPMTPLLRVILGYVAIRTLEVRE
jgi:WD40 repeat protein